MGVARVLMEDHQDDDGELTLRHWRGGWMRWHGTHWSEAEDKAIVSWAYARLEQAFYLDTSQEAARGETVEPEPAQGRRRPGGARRRRPHLLRPVAHPGRGSRH